MARKKDMVKDIALVIGGGFVEIFVEVLGDTYAPYVIIPGTQPYNMGDALGALEATAVSLIGVYKNKPKALLLGAGGLAVAVPNLVGKMVINTVPMSVAQLGNQGTSTGRYGRVVSLPPMVVTDRGRRR